MAKRKWATKSFIIIAIILGCLLIIPFVGNIYVYMGRSHSSSAVMSKLSKEKELKEKISLTLVDPEESPKTLHNTVMLGYHIMIDSPKYAKGYVGNKLSCTNCHFAGGNTTGGVNGSISLAGIAAVYPKYNQRADNVVTFPERINSCFIRSMNGKPLPLNSKEMNALITYLHWISKGFPIFHEIPWRGLKSIQIKHVPDVKNGENIYTGKCALCHGKNGEGAIRIPPLWGDESFNDGAGMNELEILASFIYANMPYEEPSLKEDEALDVAAYIRTKPRPKFQPKSLKND